MTARNSMMRRRSLVLCWVLLLVPTLVIAVAAFQLLRHEQERIDQQAIQSARTQATVIAEAIQAAIEAVENDLDASLRALPAANLEEALRDWVDHNPLVRNAFVWQRGQGLLFPEWGRGATVEERRFVARYEGLFSGRIHWRQAQPEAAGAQLQSTAAGNSIATRTAQKSKSARQQLADLAQRGSQSQSAGNQIASGSFPESGGWIPWFWENRLHLLGWVHPRAEGPVYGVELELVTVLSRLAAEFPATAPEGMAYAIVDGEGHVLHQAGDVDLAPGTKPVLTVPLLPHLPHWEVAVYLAKDSLVQAGSGFMILSGLLLGIFVVAIVTGGAFLTRQAHRDLLDAQQKTSFVSSVSHELKTPLTSIRLYAELLEEGRVQDPEKRDRYLQVIISESHRLTRLVNNVLDFSSMEQGRKKYHPEELELTGFLRELVNEHRLRVQATGMVLTERLPRPEVWLRTDRDAIGQVFLNLIDNAIKYASEGGELLVSLETRERVCEVQIMDRGPGVPAAQQAKIFEKFHRVDNSLTSRQLGSGLGLSIARQILRDLGGDLRYQARKSGGSCFVAIIPLEQDADVTPSGDGEAEGEANSHSRG